MPTPAPNSPTNTRRQRNGRALVECIVSALLLSVTMFALAESTRGTLALADDAALITRAQALATTRVETAVTHGCATNSTGTDNTARISVPWNESVINASTATLHVDATLARSPIALNRATPIAFTIVAGSICP